MEHNTNNAKSVFKRKYYENDRLPCTNLDTTRMNHALTKCIQHELKLLVRGSFQLSTRSERLYFIKR